MKLPFGTRKKEKTTHKEAHDEWAWRMNYCKIKNIPPSKSWAWEESYGAYQGHKEALVK